MLSKKSPIKFTTASLQNKSVKTIIVYYSIGFTELALEFGGKLAKVRIGLC